jgi:hypothetical protein
MYQNHRSKDGDDAMVSFRIVTVDDGGDAAIDDNVVVVVKW